MTRFSAAKPRSQLIAAFAAARATAYGVAPPVKGGDGKPAPGVSDDNEGATDHQYEPKPYHEDPDETVQCPNCHKLNDDDAVFCDQCGFELKGADDVVVKAPAADPPETPAKPPVTAAAPPPEGTHTAPKANPVDPDGNIEGSTVCANPDCGHLASAHLDDDAGGRNTGACQKTNCECLAMAVEASPNTGHGGNQTDQGAQPGPQSQELAHAPANAVPDAPAPLDAAQSSAPAQNQPPAVPGGENVGPAFTIPVAIIEGQPTGDGRQIAPGALSWRTPPLPLMGLATETHDPMGLDQNDPAVMCGRIDSLERAPGEGDTQVIVAKGVYLANEDGAYFADLNEQMGRLGISADVAVQASEIEVGEIDSDGWPSDISEILTEGEIMGLTVCPYPAFEGAYIVLGDGETEDAPAKAIPQAAQTPESVMAGGQLIHLMSYEQCAACEQDHEPISASAGPAAPPSAWFDDPGFAEGDGRLSEILDRRGQRQIAGKYACPLTVTDEGRVFGHLAPWGVCHIGKPGCVTAPQSKSDYAYFKRGQHVLSAEGDKIRVGTLTVNAGHADVHSDPATAMAHYDNIALAVADVNCGEDEYGIWVAGAIRPTATDAQVAALRASSISGDWRGLGGGLELVAALAVPVPGFPHAVVAGAQQDALVASGAQVMHRLKHPAPAPAPEPGDVALRHALAPLLSSARQLARERLAALRR